MVIPRTFPSLLRSTALLLAATTAFAGVPGFHAFGSFGHAGASVGRAGVAGIARGGFRGGMRAGFGFHGYGTVGVLPRGYMTYRWGGSPYFCSGGFWYRPWGGAYVGCYPPFGLYLPILPLACTALWLDGVRYYTYQDVYYTDAPSGGYVVAEPPTSRVAPAPSAERGDAAGDALLISPKEGQSPERMKADRSDAQRYAMQKSGYDPAYSDPNDPGTPRARKAYLRAMRTWLEDHGYTVD